MGNSKRVLVQRNLPLLCETLYRVDADVLFGGTSHLIHYPRPAREIVESESIQKDHDRACRSAELSMNWAQQQDPCLKKISNFSSLLWPVFHTDCYYQHVQRPHVSICQSDIRLSTVSVSKDSIVQRAGNLVTIKAC